MGKVSSQSGKVVVVILGVIVGLAVLGLAGSWGFQALKRGAASTKSAALAEVVKSEKEKLGFVPLEKCLDLSRADLHRLIGPPAETGQIDLPPSLLTPSSVPCDYYENAQLSFQMSPLGVVETILFQAEAGKPVPEQFRAAGIPLKAPLTEWETKLGPPTPVPGEQAACQWTVDGATIELNFNEPSPEAPQDSAYWWVTISRANS